MFAGCRPHLILSPALQAGLVSLEPLEEVGASLPLSGLEVGLCPPLVPHSAGLSQEGGAAPLFCHLKFASFKERSKTSVSGHACVSVVWPQGSAGLGFPACLQPHLSHGAGVSVQGRPQCLALLLCALGQGFRGERGPGRGACACPDGGCPSLRRWDKRPPRAVSLQQRLSLSPSLKPPPPSRPQFLSCPLMRPLSAPHAPQHSGSPPSSQPPSCS